MKQPVPDIAPDSKGSSDSKNPARSPTRRGFLGTVGSATALGLTGGKVDAATAVPVFGREPVGDADRRAVEALRLREAAALAQFRAPSAAQTTNGDEQRYPDFIGNSAKTLPHDAKGVVDADAYKLLVAACAAGTAEAFELVPQGGTRPLINPMAGMGFDLEGSDSHKTVTAAPPALVSRARALDMVELYWMALCRDVPFSQFASNALTAAAAAFDAARRLVWPGNRVPAPIP